MTKEELIADLNDTWVIIRPSPLHGIGVFAIRDIPKGCRDMFSKYEGDWIKITQKEIEQLPGYTKELIDMYCVYDDEFYYVEKTGFKKMDLSNFLNHSDNPNVIPIDFGEYFETTTDIKCGEELFINYWNLY